MAGAVANRAWRESSPDAIESDLAGLWRELAQDEVKIARAVMSNLIVVRAPSDDRRALTDIVGGLPLDEVAARHPSRTIVLEHCHREAPKTTFAAGVGIVTFGPPAARYGVEQIVVRSACPESPLLSILRRLVSGDVPTSVWWTEDLSDGPPFDPLLTVGRQLVYDSRQWRDVRRGLAAILPLVDDRRVDLADLNWRRLAPLRRALLHVRGPARVDAWRNVAIEIRHAPSESAIACLLDGWLRMERPGDPPRVAALDASSATASEAIVIATVGDATATLTTRAAEVLLPSAPPLVVAVPQESRGDAIAAELRSLSSDTALLGALRALRVS